MDEGNEKDTRGGRAQEYSGHLIRAWERDLLRVRRHGLASYVETSARGRLPDLRLPSRPNCARRTGGVAAGTAGAAERWGHTM